MRDDPLTAILAQGAKHSDPLIRRWVRSLLKGGGQGKVKPRRWRVRQGGGR
jgi:hypothetical protein